MVKFGIKDFETTLPNWAKHHKTVSLQVQRKYKDNDEIINANDSAINKIIQDEPSILKEKHERLFNFKTGKEREVIDYYLPIENKEYITPNFDYYSTGAINSKELAKVRLTFLIEEHTLKLEHHIHTEGPHSMNFGQLLAGSFGGVSDFIEDIAVKSESLKENGIVISEDKRYYNVVLVSDNGNFFNSDIAHDELVQSLVGIEIFEFDQEHKNNM
ncbi:hypothetical protein [Virgibacillus salexigens]|uniref:Uncharacterized protein n=1 Tax=Virgibacillus massiliensis TaxID=1462526 RepID=A0A024QI05_9BACI|nr:hypothetical protein [Virgibacillus massiliensis]CDQ41872.1 hypothetical protein BN990_04251 [Virgibacillus massiliensis]